MNLTNTEKLVAAALPSAGIAAGAALLHKRKKEGKTMRKQAGAIMLAAFNDEMEKIALSPAFVQRAMQNRARAIAKGTAKKGLGETVSQMQRIHGLSQGLSSRAVHRAAAAGASGGKGMSPAVLKAARRFQTEKAVEQGRRSAIKAQRGF